MIESTFLKWCHYHNETDPKLDIQSKLYDFECQAGKQNQVQAEFCMDASIILIKVRHSYLLEESYL